ncbi:MAG: hypothetical protein ACYCSJ_01480 [Acidimicrobiales bacterium]
MTPRGPGGTRTEILDTIRAGIDSACLCGEVVVVPVGMVTANSRTSRAIYVTE